MALVTPRSSNRAIFAPIAPHPRQPAPVAPSGGSVTGHSTETFHIMVLHAGKGSSIFYFGS